MENKICFGTDGIRCKATNFFFKHETLYYFCMAIAQWSISKYKKPNPKVLIGHDTRISSPRIKNAFKKGLACLPLHIVDGKILPTPAVCQLIQKNSDFDFGVVISASHNHYEDNGIKIFDAKNNKLNSIDEQAIISNFESLNKLRMSGSKESLELKNEAKEESWDNAKEIYKKNIISLFKPNFLSGIKVVLDCANGATYKVAPDIFKDLGAQVIELETKPNGKNINEKCGALHPEKLHETILQNKADLGFAFDGDGDRLIMLNKNGEIKDGDDILALLLNHPKYKNTNEVVGTIVTNHGLDQHLKKNNKTLIRTNVGDKHIAAKLDEKNLMLGGENSGHIIMKDYMNSGDGIFAALRILETVIPAKNWEMKTFLKVPQVVINLPVIQKKDLSFMPFSNIIKKQQEALKDGRLVVRYSGTENLLRITAEDENREDATNVAQNLANQLKEALKAS